MCPFCFQVNPAENHVDINDGKWEQKDITLSSERTAVVSAPEQDTSEDTAASREFGSRDLPGNPCTRKSSKAKRVKNYLKKCKDAALGNSSSTHTDEQEHATASIKEQDKREGTRVRNSRRRSNSGNREVSSTSWYVAPNLDPSPNFVSVVEVLPPEQRDETASGSTNSAVVETVLDSTVAEQRHVSSASRSSQNGPGDVLDSRNEGGTSAEFLETQDGRSPSSCVAEDSVRDACTSLCVPTASDSADAVHNAPEAPEVRINMSQLFS
jgi:hypothetical protein